LGRSRPLSGAWRRLARTIAVPLLACSLLFPGSAFAESGWDPNISPLVDGNWNKSLNWSGIAHQSSLTNPLTGYVSSVKAEWVVPAVTCAPGAPASTSSVWVGIDGFTTGTTVEQIGTQQSCTNGVASYQPFYAMYPSSSVNFNLAIRPGDRVSGQVSYAAGKFTLKLSNLTTGTSYTTTQTSTTALRRSAEFIVERRTLNGGITPLANFGTVTFTNTAMTLSQAGGTSTIIDMVNAPGNVLADSTGYQVTWKQAS
jgi:hypothetical protein